MATRNGLSVSDKLLIAAYRLDQEKSVFTAEDLVVAAWESYPDTFGLRGHTSSSGVALYPDSNRVFAEIMGSKPVRQRGLLEKTGSKTYRLTEAGRQRARMMSTVPTDPTTRATWDRRTLDEFRKLRASRAAEKFLSGRSTDLTFHDASAFWGISPRSSANELNSRLAHVAGLIEEARKLTALQPTVLEHGGIPITSNDVSALQELHDDLQSRFKTEIAVIGRRRDERHPDRE